jgi:hypothetical protein
MVSIGVGVILLGIVTAGTSAAMVYGREAMIRQEHYKAAAYILRSMMEQTQNELQIITAARTSVGAFQAKEWPNMASLDGPQDRGVGNPTKHVLVTIRRDVIEPVDDLSNNPPNGVDYFRVTLHADWRERDYAERTSGSYGSPSNGLDRTITMQTAVLVRAVIG